MSVYDIPNFDRGKKKITEKEGKYLYLQTLKHKLEKISLSKCTTIFLQIQQKKNEDQQKLGKKLEAVQATAEKEKDMLQASYDCKTH